MNRTSSASQGGSAITTKAELLQRLRERSKPQVQTQLTPNGPAVSETSKALLRENERRIALLRTSLHDAHDALETQHSFARLSGYAAARFSRTR